MEERRRRRRKEEQEKEEEKIGCDVYFEGKVYREGESQQAAELSVHSLPIRFLASR